MIFKFDRNRYTNSNTPKERNQTIINELFQITNDLNIECTRLYTPSRDSLKALFPTEKEINKVLKKTQNFIAAGFEPRLSMSLKAARTVFCYGFDPALLNTYTTPQDIEEQLTQAEWKVRKVFILNSKKSIKIEMLDTKEAKKFIASNTTSIGGIQLFKENKEKEIDPTVAQCWECGILNPTHTSRTCPGPKRCIKCLQHDHQFFTCPNIPKDFNIMTPEQKRQQYCVPCQKRGDHTSLDHKYCPEKRKIIQDRVKKARENRKNEEDTRNRDSQLIKETLELANTELWPTLQQNLAQQQRTATIILLALLEENTNQGTFNKNLEKGLKENGLPTVRYTPSPGTASLVANLFAGTSNDLPLPNRLTNKNSHIQQNIPHNTPHSDHQNLHHSKPLNKQQTGPPAHNTQHSTSINIQQIPPVHTKKLKAKKQLLNNIQNENTANDVEPSVAGASCSARTPIIIKTNTSIHARTASPQSVLRNLEEDEYIYDYETSDYYRLTSSPELYSDVDYLDYYLSEACTYCGKEYYDSNALLNHLVSKHNVPREMFYSEN